MLKVDFSNYTSRLMFSFGASDKNSKACYKKIVLEDACDEFVSSIITEEKNKSGRIYNYKQKLSSKDLKKFKFDLKGAIKSFVLNDKLHIIKHGEKTGTFIDVVKMLSV